MQKPISYKVLVYILSTIIIILALATGFYQSAYELEQKKYNKIENMYVRVRGILGREETQRLIDLSHELSTDDEFNF